MTHPRKMMLEELQRRNYATKAIVRTYLMAVRQLTEYFHRSPDNLGPDHIRRFQSYLLQEKKLSPRSIVQRNVKSPPSATFREGWRRLTKTAKTNWQTS